VKNTAAQRVEFGTAVCLSLQQFRPVDLAFEGTLAPRLRQGGPNRCKRADNSGEEAVPCRGSRSPQPSLERCHIPLAQNAAEFMDCRRRSADLGGASRQRINKLSIGSCQLPMPAASRLRRRMAHRRTMSYPPLTP
jgi:hypothetical protein